LKSSTNSLVKASSTEIFQFHISKSNHKIHFFHLLQSIVANTLFQAPLEVDFDSQKAKSQSCKICFALAILSEVKTSLSKVSSLFVA